MGRAANIIAPQSLRKPVALSGCRPAVVESDESGAVLPRVRDSLVLRLVGKKKSAVKTPSDARRAR